MKHTPNLLRVSHIETTHLEYVDRRSYVETGSTFLAVRATLNTGIHIRIIRVIGPIYYQAPLSNRRRRRRQRGRAA